MANQIKINVGGINYTVKSHESAEYLKEMAEELEQRLRRIIPIKEQLLKQQNQRPQYQKPKYEPKTIP